MYVYFFFGMLSSSFSFLVPFREPPRYKPGRRGSRKSYYGDHQIDTPGRLPSPSLSLRSLCPFSSASSSLSETSSASGGSNSASYISNNTGNNFWFLYWFYIFIFIWQSPKYLQQCEWFRTLWKRIPFEKVLWLCENVLMQLMMFQEKWFGLFKKIFEIFCKVC